MKAMILAAGLGKRMRPLTDATPKPLLRAGKQTLLDYHVERLLQLGIEEIVINTHWLSEQIEQHIAQRWHGDAQFYLSHEEELLETAGGIVNALPLLESQDKDEAFLLINGDVYFEDSLQSWLAKLTQSCCTSPAHVLLTPNPSHNTKGDFGIDDKSQYSCDNFTAYTEQKDLPFTYCGIGLYRPSLFHGLTPGPRPLGPILKKLCESKLLHASLINGKWVDVGTPERLQQLHNELI